MEKVFIKARAKINLNLEIISKREDNYHNIESVFQKVNLYDEIYISKNKENNCKIETNIERLNNQENIIYKAYIELKERFPNITGVNVKLNKKIPMEAGLAGGSTDCASFILGMNKLFQLKLSNKEMENIGGKLGADVVPCFYNKAIKVEGIGNIITEINTKFKYYIIIIKPEISCNTKEMYKRLDSKSYINKSNNSQQIICALENNNLKLLSSNLHNIFENVVKEKDIIYNLKNELIKNGAVASLMTGSGSCVYGIFENKEKAKKAYKVLERKYITYICTSYNIK